MGPIDLPFKFHYFQTIAFVYTSISNSVESYHEDFCLAIVVIKNGLVAAIYLLSYEIMTQC